ncbi:MAG: cardiolipin synthase [Verrucomicrobiota bacterium]|jgi:cardiolipin synthase A/B|nr:cardiolipin synthase [Verrucomicrobiota bacterium]
MMDWSLLYLITEWSIRFVMFIYVPQRRSPAAARTWLLFIFLLPGPGLLLYWLFGRSFLPKRRLQMQARASEFVRRAQAQIGVRLTVDPLLPAGFEFVPGLVHKLGDFETLAGNRVELLPGYNETIDRIIDDIDSASRNVHLLFYIFLGDETGRRIAAALERAASRGVTCRVLMDAVGSRQGVRNLAPRLRKSGVEVLGMLPVSLFRKNATRFDLRNHRKIVVIDGSVGYTGSQNIVNPEFVKGYPNEELMVRVTGPVVAQLQAMFLADHYFETGKVLDRKELFPDLIEAGESPAQVLPSGPGYGQENGRELIIAMLYAARERIVITTPYFVPDEPFLQAIRAASLRGGIEVHLVLSMHTNQVITQLAQKSYYDDLLQAGICIHLYRPYFLHAKHLTIDNDIALIGSTNMDIRSFALNAEVNLLVYDRGVVQQLRTVQERYFANSDQLKADTWSRRVLGAKLAQNTARLMDSFL